MKSIAKICFFSAVFAACQNTTAPAPTPAPANDGAAILKHKYWVSKPFNDALFAGKIIDTLSYLPCAELVFDRKDTVILTSCLSDAGRGFYKATSTTSMAIAFEGFEGASCTATLDEKTGILHLTSPGGTNDGWPTEFVAQDDISVKGMDDLTVQLGRKRLAGKYTMLPKKGEMAITSLMELRPDGTQVGLGDFDNYEPWVSGIGGGFISEPAYNVMYLNKKDKMTTFGWQMNGDTLRMYDTKDISQEGDMPEYRVTKLRGIYLKVKQ